MLPDSVTQSKLNMKNQEKKKDVQKSGKMWEELWEEKKSMVPEPSLQYSQVMHVIPKDVREPKFDQVQAKELEMIYKPQIIVKMREYFDSTKTMSMYLNEYIEVLKLPVTWTIWTQEDISSFKAVCLDQEAKEIQKFINIMDWFSKDTKWIQHLEVKEVLSEKLFRILSKSNSLFPDLQKIATENEKVFAENYSSFTNNLSAHTVLQPSTLKFPLFLLKCLEKYQSFKEVASLGEQELVLCFMTLKLCALWFSPPKKRADYITKSFPQERLSDLLNKTRDALQDLCIDEINESYTSKLSFFNIT